MRLLWAPPTLLALLLLASAPFSNAQSCAPFFTSIGDNLEDFGKDQVYQHPTTTSELEGAGTSLLEFQWTENALGDPTIVAAGSDTSYLEGVVTSPSMKINTISSLRGLTDYSSDWVTPPKVDVRLVYNFPVIDETANIDGGICTLYLVFPLEDKNTASPAADSTNYNTNLREDFPLSLAIPYLEVIVQDLDGAAPNNLLTASFDPSCPLTTVESQYDGKGQNVIMTYMLTQKLDYDTMETPELTCQVIITDGGTDPSPLLTEVTISITVEGFEDEPPVFESSFYTSIVETPQTPGTELTIQPSTIKANDADKDGSAIVYSMTASDVDGPEWNDYFTIDESTAAVSLTQKIPNSMLGVYSTHFILTATDGNSNSDTSTLEIVLPPASTTSTTSSTTTTTTSTTTTTTPATTPTTTPCPTLTTPTSVIDTCPPCPTTELFTTPPTSTLETETCPPCPTSSCTTPAETTPMLETCTPCPTTSCTTPAETTSILETCPPCPTTSCTTPAETTSILETCPPCPTTSATGTTSTTTTTTSAPGTSEETIPAETCPPCTTVINTCPTAPETSGSSSTTVPSTEEIKTTVEIVTSSTESGLTEPVCQTCDPCECPSPSTYEPDGSSSSPPTVPSPGTSPEVTPPTTPSTTSTVAPEYEYMFERAAYNFEVYPTSKVAGTLKVVRTDGSAMGEEDVVYQWDESASNGTEYFVLDARTGQVLVSNPAEGSYTLKAIAVVDQDYFNLISSDVYINVLKPSTCDGIFLGQGLIYTSMSESEDGGYVIETIQTQDGIASNFCIVAVRPDDFEENFEVKASGELILAKSLDVDDLPVGYRSVAVWIKALAKGEICPSDDVVDTDRTEVIVVINIEDENDEAPTITSPSSDARVGYPSNKGLQEVVGPVLNIEVEDKDTEGDLTFTLSGEDSSLFLMEETTGNLYLTDPSSCSDECQVTVTVSDGLNQPDQREVTVVPLNTEKIYDIAFGQMTTSEIQDEIQGLSESSGFDLHLLYSSIALSDGDTNEYRVLGRYESAQTRRLRRSTSLRDSSWVSVAHVYGFDDQGNYISLDDLNSVLPDDEKASTFSEKETFSPTAENTDVTGYQVAVGILGTLLAIILVAAVVGFFWYRKRKQQATDGSSPLNTLSSAYPNHAFSTEMNEIANDNKSSTSSRSGSRRVSVLSPTSTGDNNSPDSTTPEENQYEEPFNNTEVLQKSAYPAAAASVGMERKASQHSLGGLHRIDPGPSPDGAKSSPYLSMSEGDFEVTRPTEDENVASFTAYKGGQKTKEELMPIKVSSSYAPVPKSKKEPTVSFGSTSEIVDDGTRSRAESGASSKKSYNGYGVAVRAKKEPPDVSAASPAKPIMKKKSVTVEVHHDAEEPVAAGSFSNLQSSPTIKKKKKTKTSSSSDEDTAKTKDTPSEGGTSDYETKKSVAFKVLVDQKEIERINHDEESGTENF